MTGHFLTQSFGLKGALVGLIIGFCLLLLLSLTFVKMAFHYKKVLIELVQFYFGTPGAQLCGLAFVISLMGWFALQMEVMTTSLIQSISYAPVEIVTLLFTLLIISNVLFGTNGLKIIAQISIPFLLIVMGYTAYLGYEPSHVLPVSHWKGAGIPLVIAFSITGIIDSPTYFCTSKTLKDAYIATSLVYLLLLPFMAGLGVIIALYHAENNLVLAIHSLLGRSWGLLATIVIVLSGWTTNNGNLYLSSMAL